MRISLGQSATIIHAPAHHATLLEGFACGEDLEIDVSGLVEADLSLIQLLEAARTHAAASGIGLRLVGTDAPGNPLRLILERNGFRSRTGKAEREFWQLEETAS